MLYLFVVIKNVIHETYNIIYNILKCCKYYKNYLNVIVINLHKCFFVSYFLPNVILSSKF